MALPRKAKAQRKQTLLKPTQASVKRHHLQIKHSLFTAAGLNCKTKSIVQQQNTHQHNSLAHKPDARASHVDIDARRHKLSTFSEILGQSIADTASFQHSQLSRAYLGLLSPL